MLKVPTAEPFVLKVGNVDFDKIMMVGTFQIISVTQRDWKLGIYIFAYQAEARTRLLFSSANT